MQPLISIALCTYNGAEYLSQQLLSIVNQTYKNIEIVIVDDCSTDNTIEIVKSFTKDFSQVKFYQNTKNLGFNKNFEKAIQLTTGDYVAISDQDDIWELNKLELLYNNIGNNWLIFSNSAFIDEKNNPINKTLIEPSFKLGKRDFRSLLFYNFVTGHTALFARTFFPYIFPIPSSGYYDWWMGFIALYHKKIVYLNKTLTLHRIHNNSVMNKEEQISSNNPKKARFLEKAKNLEILMNYPNLNSEDKQLITVLHNSFKKKSKFNTLLIAQIIKNYPYFFPDLKKRNIISRFNFALKMGY
nr:glycosyltransferase family 2 protein [Pedobacter sp. ASV2]